MKSYIGLYLYLYLYRRVPSRAFPKPMHFFTSSDTFVVECIVQPQHTAKKRQNFVVWNSGTMGTAITWPWLFQTRHFQRSVLQLYNSCTIGLLSDSYA